MLKSATAIPIGAPAIQKTETPIRKPCHSIPNSASPIPIQEIAIQRAFGWTLHLWCVERYRRIAFMVE
jgi:hypothetical protein